MNYALSAVITFINTFNQSNYCIKHTKKTWRDTASVDLHGRNEAMKLMQLEMTTCAITMVDFVATTGSDRWLDTIASNHRYRKQTHLEAMWNRYIRVSYSCKQSVRFLQICHE